MAPRATLRSFAARLLDAPAFPLTRSAFFSLVALAAFRALLSYRGLAPIQAQVVVATASLGAFWAYIFYIIRHTASGQFGLGVPDFRDVKEDLFGPAIKGAAATALIWAPALLYLLLSNDWDLGALASPQKFLDPVIWGLVLVGVAYCPMALVAAATDIELLGMLNPLQVIRYIARTGRDYFTLVIALGIMTVPAGLIQVLLVPALRGLPIPFLCRWLAEAASLYVPFVMARMLGTLLQVHGHALDWGSPSEYDDPVLPGARPRGAAPPLGPEAPSVPVAPIASAAPAPVASAAPAPAGEQIARALAADDLAEAVALYAAAGRLAPGDLAPDQHFAVGRAAATTRQYALAVRALKIAAFSPHDIAPRALVTLAQVYGDGMRDPDSAERLFQETLKRFPDSPAAAFARERLAAHAR
jgi:hypothetical protein